MGYNIQLTSDNCKYIQTFNAYHLTNSTCIYATSNYRNMHTDKYDDVLIHEREQLSLPWAKVREFFEFIMPDNSITR
jgi:hypothetical protein